jgi:hypothetical protein
MQEMMNINLKEMREIKSGQAEMKWRVSAVQSDLEGVNHKTKNLCK